MFARLCHIYEHSVQELRREFIVFCKPASVVYIEFRYIETLAIPILFDHLYGVFEIALLSLL